MLTLLRKKVPYAGRHADDSRAPTGTACAICGEKQLGVPEKMLAHCSICATWLCSGGCYSLHRAPAEFYAPPARRSWWKRVTSRG